jgi:hypothetical protein
MKNSYLPIVAAALLISAGSKSQNIAVNTDGTSAETGVMLDVKGTNSISTTATQNVFQIKSNDANGLKMRMILGTNATAGSTYGGLEVYDAVNSAYRNIFLVPNGGNVGIGATTAVGKLTVWQSANGYANGILTYGSAVSGEYLALSTLGAGQATIQSGDNATWQQLLLNPYGGNVGIGMTSAPGDKLDVAGNIRSSTGSTITFTTGSFASGLAAEVSNTLVNFGINDSRFGTTVAATQGGFYRADSRAGLPPLQLYVRPASGTLTEVFETQSNFNMYLAPTSGNVGIGVISTSSPSQKLDVNGKSIFRDDVYAPKAGAANYSFNSQNSGPWTGCTLGTTCTGWTTNAYFPVVGDWIVNVTRGKAARITSLCLNVGAGQNSVNHDPIPGNTAGDLCYFYTDGSGVYPDIGSTATASTDRFGYVYAQGIMAASFVGIGTTSPTEALHVVGNICYTGTSGACSDIRYKKDFAQLTKPLENILKINGLYYYWKKDEFPDKQFTSNRQIGFIAQDIEKIYPELVMTDKDGYKSVDYSRLTPVLVEAMKEQQKIIDKQQADIDAMKKDNEQIKAALQTLLKQNGSAETFIGKK